MSNDMPRRALNIVMQSACDLGLEVEVVALLAKAKDPDQALTDAVSGWQQATGGFGGLHLPPYIWGFVAEAKAKDLQASYDEVYRLAVASHCIAALFQSCGAHAPDDIKPF